MLGISGLPAVLQIILMLCFPESPKWLIKMNRKEEADIIMNKIFNTNHPQGLLEKNNEVSAITEELELEDSNQSLYVKYKELFAVYKKIVFIGVMLQIWQQLTGINTVMYYSPTILDNAGFGSKDDHDFVISKLMIKLNLNCNRLCMFL